MNNEYLFTQGLPGRLTIANGLAVSSLCMLWLFYSFYGSLLRGCHWSQLKATYLLTYSKLKTKIESWRTGYLEVRTPLILVKYSPCASQTTSELLYSQA